MDRDVCSYIKPLSMAVWQGLLSVLRAWVTKVTNRTLYQGYHDWHVDVRFRGIRTPSLSGTTYASAAVRRVSGLLLLWAGPRTRWHHRR